MKFSSIISKAIRDDVRAWGVTAVRACRGCLYLLGGDSIAAGKTAYKLHCFWADSGLCVCFWLQLPAMLFS
jgi:hypothetical protein